MLKLTALFSRPAVTVPAVLVLIAPASLTLLAAPPPVRAQAPVEGKTLVVGSPGTQAILPPALPWAGKSRSLLVPAGDPWVTPFEATGGTHTPRYDATVAWLRKLADASPRVDLVSLGKSAEGRDIWMVAASAEGPHTADAFRESGKPTLLIQAGIHAGEIDGKDAGMMLLRDMTVRGKKGDLLAGANFLFVPIFNVDGHERFSAYGRINQRGPAETGWRTTSSNQNLNRDYTKIDTPEMAAMIQALVDWDPDLYVDVHVTDGCDYQYDITWGYNGPHAYSPNAAAWLDTYLTPRVTRDLKALGHVPGPLVYPVDPLGTPSRGIVESTFSPRYSHGYGDVRHIPSILVENHSLKPYEQRVLGTYLFLESTLRVMGEHGKELRRAKETDRRQRRDPVPLDWKIPDTEPATMEFLGVKSRLIPSAISGGLQVVWTGDPVTEEIPVRVQSEPAVAVARPRAYWIPPAYPEVAARIEQHGIRVERSEEAQDVDVRVYRLPDAEPGASPYEGHMRVSPGTPVPERRTVHFPAGSVRVPTDQPLGDLAVLLLEPGSPDSFFQWGFFLGMLQRTEYVEGYIMEPLASRMLAETPGLAHDFQEKLRSDPEFAASPEARLRWFYVRTPFADTRWKLYPVAREE